MWDFFYWEHTSPLFRDNNSTVKKQRQVAFIQCNITEICGSITLLAIRVIIVQHLLSELDLVQQDFEILYAPLSHKVQFSPEKA